MEKNYKTFNKFFFAWEIMPHKKVLRYGKMVTLKRLNEYEDYKYYNPKRQAATIIQGLAGVADYSVKRNDNRRENKVIWRVEMGALKFENGLKCFILDCKITFIRNLRSKTS